jgi:glycosyltransferase involved in cell wall biosynthesis
MRKKKISIIVPTYNQEIGINELFSRVTKNLRSIQKKYSFEIIFINDFSTDRTYEKLKNLARKSKQIKVVNFSRNFGNQIAIAAGIDYCTGDLAIIIDDDLQDPPEVIIDLVDKYEQGFNVVYGIRRKRIGTSPLFRFLAYIYYRFINSLSQTYLPKDVGDFRLIDKNVIESLRTFKEKNRYYRGLISWVGFKQTGIYYDRDARFSGNSNFTLKKYINFAVNGLTSFTEKPLYFAGILGFIITLISFCFAFYIFYKRLTTPDYSIQGWTSIALLVIFFGGIQLMCLGILSIYVSKIFQETKQRPLYLVQSLLNLRDN